MSHPLVVLSTNQAAFDHVRDSVAAYNRVADRVIPRLIQHRDRITAAWRDRRSLCDDVRELLTSIDAKVYRNAMFRLNEAIEMIHRLDAAGPGQTAAAEIGRLDAEKERLTEAARVALERMTESTAELIGDLERELEA